MKNASRKNYSEICHSFLSKKFWLFFVLRHDVKLIVVKDDGWAPDLPSSNPLSTMITGVVTPWPACVLSSYCAKLDASLVSN